MYSRRHTQYSERNLVNKAAKAVGIYMEWKREGFGEKEYDKSSGKCLVEVDKRHFLPTEVDTLFGDPTNAKKS